MEEKSFLTLGLNVHFNFSLSLSDSLCLTGTKPKNACGRLFLHQLNTRTGNYKIYPITKMMTILNEGFGNDNC
jgi:hypothetical protein